MSLMKVAYGVYFALVGISAGLVLTPGAPLGLLTNAMQTLAGALLPSATVFLLLLCNEARRDAVADHIALLKEKLPGGDGSAHAGRTPMQAKRRSRPSTPVPGNTLPLSDLATKLGAKHPLFAFAEALRRIVCTTNYIPQRSINQTFTNWVKNA
ncbi:MAG: hypothetical protein ACR652_11160 [Methylocystis sp.]|uniref:hypothetical protein n=1 Tax=Methylocystis sp. TaxID=1911079 RepID=UPI003DA5E37C